MSDFMLAADAVKKFHQQFLALEQVAEALQKVGSLEQSLAETNARIRTAREEEQAVKERIQAALDKIPEAEAKAREIIERTGRQAKETLAAAEADRQRITDGIEASQAAGKARLAELQSQEQQVRSQCDEARRELQGINLQIAGAKETLASFKERIGKL